MKHKSPAFKEEKSLQRCCQGDQAELGTVRLTRPYTLLSWEQRRFELEDLIAQGKKHVGITKLQHYNDFGVSEIIQHVKHLPS